ncbi:MAG TPA: hypothetical protein VGK32_10350 [Vicinamibacterales bacterium]|jgi:hypothetical protein
MTSAHDLQGRRRAARVALWGFGLALLSLASVAVGMIQGFRISLIPAYQQTAYQKYVVKGSYYLDRRESIDSLPEDFGRLWLPMIREWTRHNTIGVYVGNGINATPFFPNQLESLGFRVVRFGDDDTGAIRECRLIIFPGGHYDVGNIPQETRRTLGRFVEGGGGFIGICLGLVAAKEIGLVEGELVEWPVTGLISGRIVDHTVFKHAPVSTDVTFLHMNGRLLTGAIALKPLVMLGDEVLAGAREFGKGKVVLFSSHPEGGKIEYGNDYVIAEGTSLHTMDLLLDAIFYVSGQ